METNDPKRPANPAAKREENAGLKMLLELGPVALFALTYYFGQSIIDAMG